VNDVDDALAWVIDNQQSYGASGKPVLFGQSAGGHLAASIAVRKPELVERSVVFYAPVDFADLAEQLESGAFDGERGSGVLQAVTRQTIETLDPGIPVVAANSFPQVIHRQPQQFPEFFILHGESDTLVPSRQSQRLCDALAGKLGTTDNSAENSGGIANSGSIENGGTDFTSVLRSTACNDRGSQLHLIAQGDHALDLCVSDELCLSGTPASAGATAEVVQSMLDWSSADKLIAFRAAADSGVDRGSGSLNLQLILLLCGLLLGDPPLRTLMQARKKTRTK